MAHVYQNVRDTAANWTTNNPTLPPGVLGYETDTGKWKLGNGSTTWNSLAYWFPASAQAALVSGVNIKTINNESLLGSGNLTIESSSSGASVEDCIVYAIALGG